MLNDIPGMTAVRHRALGKVARRFLLILTIAYVLNYLDRTSVGRCRKA